MRILTILSTAFLIMGAFVNAPVMAAEVGAIAVVDVRFILTQSKAAQSIQQQRAQMHSAFLAEISETEKALRDEEQALLKEREAMDADDFLQKKQEYERKLLETGRAVREKKQSLEESLTEAMTRLQDKLSDIVQTIAQERGYELVITKQSVLVGADKLDLTAEALEQLNAQMPDMKLNASADGG